MNADTQIALALGRAFMENAAYRETIEKQQSEIEELRAAVDLQASQLAALQPSDPQPEPKPARARR